MGQSKWLDYIKEQTARMAALVTELLTLSRLDEEAEGASADVAAFFDAPDALMECALPFESAAYEQNMTLRTEAPEHLTLSGNPDDFKKIVDILIDNAIKHTHAGGEIVLTLREGTTRRSGREEAVAELSVTNTGETIPPEALPHIFERFYKADASRAYTGDSFGLGLAIAKALAEKHGGTISASSENGKTEFLLRVPRGKV